MRRLYLLLLATLAAPVAMAEETSRVPDPTPPSAENRFACALYSGLRAQDGNLFCSPFSVRTALVMTYAGARGKTAAEMAAVLRLPEGGDIHAALGARMADLSSTGGPDRHELAVANALWGQQGETFLDSYRSLVERHYAAGFRRADFRADPEAARKTINDWVEQRTRQRIRELLRPGLLTRDTSLVLTNAIYFKGTWQRPFSAKATGDRPFRLGDGRSVRAPTMHQIARFGYAEAKGVQALELAYKGGRITLVVLLPDDLPAFEKGLDASGLQALTDRLATEKVSVFLPRFEVTSRFSLADTLAALGMPTAFSGGADFSGMDGKGGLFISAVEHKAFVAVDESGTEASAATAVVMKRGGLARGTKLFRADRPFLFLIRDRKTGRILFLGRVLDPRAPGA
ncbi:MAG: serpin family protein [Planctomycetota bacterium]|jgi:serpin B